MDIAIVVPAGFDRERALARVAGVAGAGTCFGEVTLLSNAGRHLDLRSAEGAPAHLFAAAAGRFQRMFVVKEFAALYANDFTLAWLGLLLADQGEGAELWLEIPDEGSNARRNLVTPGFLDGRLPGASFARAGKGWYRLPPSPGLAAEPAALPTIYPAFHGRFEDFLKTYGRATAGTEETTAVQRDAAERSFIYGLYGANQKSFVVEHILASHGLRRAIRGLDAGGGYGFLAAELAAKGHDFLVSDYDEKKIDLVGPWIAERCGLGPRLRFVTERLEAIDRPRVHYDLVSFFGCLLYLERRDVPKVLSRAMQLLRPRGLLLVHENPREAGKPGSLDYERRFAADELAGLIQNNAGRFTCYSMFTAKPVPWAQAARSVIMAAVQRRE